MKSPWSLALLLVPVVLAGAAPASAAATSPNLVVPSATVTAPATVAHGGTFKVTARIKNIGKATARGSRYAVLLSLDSVRSVRDVTVATGATPRLTGGQMASVARSVTVPTKVAYATYRVLVCADATQLVAESREGDNCRLAAAKVKVAPVTPLPDADHDGVPDTSDCRPFDDRLPLPGHLADACFASVYEVHDTNGAGAGVMTNVIVSAVDAVHDRIDVQLKPGDLAYTVPDNSAVEVDMSGLASAPSVGDRVSIKGTSVVTSSGVLVTATSLDIVGAAEAVPPLVVTPQDLATHAAQYDALLIELDNQSIGTVTSGSWTMSGSPAYDVAPQLTTLPELSAGASITSLVGIADTYDFSAEVWPRGASDVMPAP